MPKANETVRWTVSNDERAERKRRAGYPPQNNNEEVPMLAYRHRLIFVTFTLAWLLYIDRIAISTAKGPLTAAFGLSDTQFGWALSAFALGYALSQIPAGMIVDRFGPRLVLGGLWLLSAAAADWEPSAAASRMPSAREPRASRTSRSGVFSVPR